MRPSNGLAMVPFYTKYVLKSGKEGNALILGVMLLSAVFWWPLLRKITLKIGSKKMFILSTIIFVLSLQPLLLLSNLNLILLAMMLVGCGNAGIQLVRNACLSDVIDEDELRTGVRREGAYWNNDILRAFDVYSPRSSFRILV